MSQLETHWKSTDSEITPSPYTWQPEAIKFDVCPCIYFSCKQSLPEQAPIISHNTWNRCSDQIFISDDVEAAVWSQIGRSDGGSWTCLVCSYSTHHKTNMFQHVEAKHVQTGGYHCPLCQKFCPNSKSLKNHKSRCPNKSPRIGVWVSPPHGYIGLPLLEKA